MDDLPKAERETLEASMVKAHRSSDCFQCHDGKQEYAGKVLSRTRILNHVWGYSFDPGSKVVDVYIRYLRQKIDEGHETALIKTVRGFGYRYRPRAA